MGEAFITRRGGNGGNGMKKVDNFFTYNPGTYSLAISTDKIFTQYDTYCCEIEFSNCNVDGNLCHGKIIFYFYASRTNSLAPFGGTTFIAFRDSDNRPCKMNDNAHLLLTFPNGRSGFIEGQWFDESDPSFMFKNGTFIFNMYEVEPF